MTSSHEELVERTLTAVQVLERLGDAKSIECIAELAEGLLKATEAARGDVEAVAIASAAG